MTLRGELAQRRVVRAVALEEDGDEEPVLAIHRGRPERLRVHRHQALAVLPQRLGEELLDPGSERAELVREDEGDLVAAGGREGRQRRAEPEARVLGQGHLATARVQHVLGALDEALHVHAR